MRTQAYLLAVALAQMWGAPASQETQGPSRRETAGQNTSLALEPDVGGA